MKKRLCVCLMIAVMALLAVRAGAEELDASGQWRYVLKDGGTTITGYEAEPEGELSIPSELDGYAVTGIGRWAFSECSDLTGVTIPDSVTSIGVNPFAFCPLLLNINVSSNSLAYEQMDGVLFDKQRKMLISYPGGREGAYTIPEGILIIGESAFQDCSGLTKVTIPDSVTSIRDFAFSSCQGLTSVTIPDSVTSIALRAFSYCSGLVSVTIPVSVTSIGENPFVQCPLSYIGVSPDNPTFEQMDGVLFDKQRKVLVSYPGGREGTYTIPEGVQVIGDCAFEGCFNLTSVTIPNSVTSIADWAFGYCSGLTSVIIPNSVVSIGSYAFSGCDGLTNLTIGDSVTSIGNDAFEWCSGLTSVIIPNSVTSIGDGAFAWCSSLTSVTIPNSVTSIDDDAFEWCKKVTLSVEQGSYAEQYAKDNDIPYTFIE